MKLFTFVSVLFFTAVSFADSFKFRLPGYPKTNPDCLILASELAETFAQSNALPYAVGLCEAVSEYGYDILIEYENDSAIPVESTWPSSAGVFSRARFAKAEDCQKVLEQETKLFMFETGLKPAFVYCQKEYGNEKRGWAPHITGFGKSIRQYQVSGFVLFTRPEKAVPLRERLIKVLPEHQATFVDVTVTSKLAMADVAIHAYSSEKLVFEIDDNVRAQTKEICELQIGRWNEAFQYVQQEPLISFCGTAAIATEFEMASVFVGKPKLKSTMAQEKFPSYEACETSRPSLLEKFANLLKRPIAGGVCSWGKGGYQLRVLYLP